MKRSTVQFIFALKIIGLLGIISCDQSGDTIDTTPPTIELQDPEASEYMEADDYAHLEARFTDDFELATYNLEIHENFDSHAHGRITVSNDDPSLIKWSYSQNFSVPAGLRDYNAIHDDEIEIPANTMAGPYHYIVQAIDASGNATSFQDGSTVEIEIYITNDSQPVINITSLEEGELEIEVGAVFMVTGDVTDPTIGEYAGMHRLDILLGEGQEEHGHDHGRIASDDLIDVIIEEEELELFMVDEAIILDKIFEDINFVLTQEQLDELIAEEIDHLTLTIRVHDEQGNIAITNTPVHVHVD